jgi:hypothetical protein
MMPTIPAWTPTAREIDGVQPWHGPLTNAQKKYCKDDNLCSYFGEFCHSADKCSEKSKDPAKIAISSNLSQQRKAEPQT